MKKFRFLTLALAALTIASCSKEEGPTVDSGVVSGEATHATFSFNIDGKPSSRAGGMEDTQGDPETDDLIKEITVLVFNEEGDQNIVGIGTTTAGTPTSLTLPVTSGLKRIYAFANATTEMKNELQGLKDGNKQLKDLYLLMTNPSAGNAAADETSIAEMTAITGFTMSNYADASSKALLKANISAGNAPAQNAVALDIYRTVAKGSLRVSAVGDTDIATVDTHYTLANPTAPGITSIRYGVRNVNSSVNFVQLYANDDNPHATSAGAQERPFAPYYNNWNSHDKDALKLVAFENWYFSDYPIDGTNAQVFGQAGRPTNSVYFTENSNLNQVIGNSTYFGISASVKTVAAAKIVAKYELVSPASTPLTSRKYNNTSETAVDYDNTAGGKDLYVIRKNITTHNIWNENLRIVTSNIIAFQMLFHALEVGGYISTPNNILSSGIGTGITIATGAPIFADAAALQAAFETIAGEGIQGYNNLEIAKILDGKLSDYFGAYANGRCYYRLNIFETIGGNKTHFIRRNHDYDAEIQRFLTIGVPVEGDLDLNPELDLDQSVTHVDAQLTVKPWTKINVPGEV